MINVQQGATHDMSEETLRQILCQKLEEGRGLAAQFFTIFTLFMVMNGVLLKAWSDSSPDHTERQWLIASLGLALVIISLVTSRFPYKVRRDLISDINRLNNLLGRPLESEQLTLPKYIVLSSQYFASSVGVLWFILLVRLVS